MGVRRSGSNWGRDWLLSVPCPSFVHHLLAIGRAHVWNVFGLRPAVSAALLVEIRLLVDALSIICPSFVGDLLGSRPECVRSSSREFSCTPRGDTAPCPGFVTSAGIPGRFGNGRPR